MSAMYLVWRFRGQLAQAADHQLDERQVAIRDRAYLDRYRLLAALVLGTLVGVAIVHDILGRTVTLGFDTINWYVMGFILISIALPSAVVAWREPDLPMEA